MIGQVLSKPELMSAGAGMVEPEAFTVLRHRIPVRMGKQPNVIKIGIFGDVHRDSAACNVDAWHNQLDAWRKDKDIYFIGLGDYLDFSSYSERLILDNPKLHDQTKGKFDEWQTKTTKDFIKEISFMKGRILGMIEGNHYWRFQDHTTSTQRMCQSLDAPYMGVTGIIRISLKEINSNRISAVDIWCHHGMGGARLVGGSINKVEQMREVFPNMDMYILGHDHRRLAVPVSCLGVSECGTEDKLLVRERRQWLIRSGSYLKGYDPGKANYVNRRLLPPSDLGSITAEIAVSRVRNGTHDHIKTDIRAYC